MNSNWTRTSFKVSAEVALADGDFCLPNLLAGTVGIVAGRAGIGKTSLLMQLGASVATGIAVANGALPAPKKTGKVVFLAAEDPPVIMRRRAYFLARSLVAQGYGGDVIDRLEDNMQVFSLNGHCPILLSPANLGETAIDRVAAHAKDARLVILDPIRRFHLCDEQHYTQMALLFDILSDLAARTGCTILFSHHLSPDVGVPTASDAAQGASAFVNATRWLLELYPMTESEMVNRKISSSRRADFVLAKLSKTNYGRSLEPFWLERSPQFEGVFQHFTLASN